MLSIRRSRALGLCLLLASVAVAQTKRPITSKDWDSWRSISSQVLSRDGKTLAYAYMPQDGDGEIVIRNLATGKEQREGVGALPPPVIAPADSDAPPPQRSIRLSFTSDGAYVLAGTYPTKAETAQAKKDKKKPDEMPKQGLLIVKVATGEAVRVASVKSFQVPEKGGAWVAFLKEAAPAAKPADAPKPPADDAEIDQARRGATGDTGSPKKDYGTDLVLRELASNSDKTYQNVTEYAFTRDGKTLLYTVSSKKEDENGLYAAAPGSDTVLTLASGKGKYAKLVLDREQVQAALFFDKSALLWKRGDAAAAEAVGAKTQGIPNGMVVSDKGSLAFSRDGKRLFVPVAPPAKEEKKDAESTDEKVLMDLWHWKDDRVQTIQKIRANQERNRTYRGVYHLADKSYVQLATPQMATINPTDDGLKAIGSDDRAYRPMAEYDGGYSDLYVVDTLTGQRKSLLRKARGGMVQTSPDGKWGYLFQNKGWYRVSLTDASMIAATGGLKVAFHDEEEDTPSEPGSYGAAGWAKDSQSFLVYDRYDLWQLFVDGRAPRCLTAGEGRKAHIQFRYTRTEPTDEDDERGIDLAKPLILRAESEDTRETGFYRASTGAPQRLLWGAKAWRYVTRAKEADVLLVAATRFDEYPDLQVTNGAFQAPKKVTEGAKQMEPFAWGKGELANYVNADGVKLQMAIYKPANFDPKKKYPLMVYIYEKLAENVHTFVEPRPSHNVNFSQYTSKGYVIITPDIVYEVGHPGKSAMKCVLPAVQAMVDQGFIDEARIGIQGHSWGGYQIAYMVTQTTRFRAAEAGAPVGNMTSAYGGIRWGSGLPRQFQYEKTQSRIGPTLYDEPQLYFENSPIFHVRRVKTPLLILHDDNDDAVPWYQGIELFLALRRTGKEAYLMNYNGELHGLRRRHNQKDYAVRMEQFFDHYLLGAPRPEWMEKGVPFIDREEEKERFTQAQK